MKLSRSRRCVSVLRCFVGGALLLASLCSCGRDDAERREWARLDRALRQLQDAENSRKGPLLEALERTECERHCPLRNLCVEAYRNHGRALELIAEAKDATEKGADASAVDVLARARATLDVARAQTKDCARLQADLRRTWGN